MTTYNLDYTKIGRLEVGTETLIDKSKSVKTSLMRLFSSHGNHDIEGVDSKNACYGGTAALFNSVAWVESSAYDGRYAMVVMGDIALYEKGPARPTGGAGALALLIGPNAPLVLEGPCRASYMEDTNDFYKPNMNSEFPIVNGQLSLQSYLTAFSHSYPSFLEKQRRALGKHHFPDYYLFHCPYGKLIQKVFSKKYSIDCQIRGEILPLPENVSSPELKDARVQKEIESFLIEVCRCDFERQTAPSLAASKVLGNIYCGSLYASLLSLLSHYKDALVGSRLGLFSYGSGLASTFFSIYVADSVINIVEKVDLFKRLDDRCKMTPQDFVNAIQLRLQLVQNPCAYIPAGDLAHIRPQAYYLDFIDSFNRRHYAKNTNL
jgi:hydroxymethylglutaryl-CoA synthase